MPINISATPKREQHRLQTIPEKDIPKDVWTAADELAEAVAEDPRQVFTIEDFGDDADAAAGFWREVVSATRHRGKIKLSLTTARKNDAAGLLRFYAEAL